MANRWLLVGVMALSACGGGAMREVVDPSQIDSNLKGKPALGKCKSNPTGFEVELGYRNKTTNMLGYPDHVVPFNYVGENRFVVGEKISLKALEILDPALEPVFIFPDRCFESVLKSATYRHLELRPDQEQLVLDTQTFEADRQNQMQFSLLDSQSGGANAVSVGATQNYEINLVFSDGTEAALSIQAVIDPSFPELQIATLGLSSFSNSPGEWANSMTDWAAPRVFDVQRVTNPSDRPLLLWLNSNSTFTLRIGSQCKIDESKILNADGYFSIHTVRINGVDREIGYQGIVSVQINPKETVEIQWIVSPSTAQWTASPPNLGFKKTSEIENFDKGYQATYGALFGKDLRSIAVSELDYVLGQPDAKPIYTRETNDGHLFWNSFPNGDVNYHSFYVIKGLVFTGK